jgi:16S rRNA (cytosine1402-N4)-methyltransferase
MSSTHISVLKLEAVDALQVKAGGRYIDATLGGAGHTIEIAKKGGLVLGIDTDTQALEIAKGNLISAGVTGWTLAKGNFRDIEQIAKDNGFEKVDGILFDLGVSSFQLDTPERGFSYRFTDAPLDLRMNQSSGGTASELVNSNSEEELYEIFATYGEEQFSRDISRAICRARSVNEIKTIADLVAVVTGAVKGVHNGVLSRVFQALRIAVNDELGSIRSGMDGAEKLIASGGMLVVISFHSLEDRIVKQYMLKGDWKVITKHPLLPTEEEIGSNRRSRSAKLRIAQKI